MSDEENAPKSEEAIDSDSEARDKLEIRLSAHAEKKIAERNLDRNQVIAMATEPEQIVEEEGKPLLAQSHITLNDKQYLLRIPFRDENQVRLIITVYLTSQVDKYWKKEAGNED